MNEPELAVATAGGGCNQKYCFAPDTACVLGVDPCEFFAGPTPAEQRDNPTGPPLPWSGLPLGLADLTAIAATGPVRIVALVGPADAGKTTALAAHWIAARRGAGQHGSKFAGSYTLLGWQRIARHLQWVPYGSGGFPPHTSATSDRAPSLLHAVLRGAPGATNLLYTDVPGEWFRVWAYDAQAAPGVRWIVEHADAFVILADSEALSGPERGTARADYEAIAARLASVASGRAVIPVWTKADKSVPDPMRKHVESLNERLFASTTTSVSVHERAHGAITDAVDLGVTAALERANHVDLADDREADPLYAFRSTALGGQR